MKPFDKLLFRPLFMRGHKVFQNDDGQISLADWSGDTPHDCEDGPLIIAPGARILADIPNLADSKPVYIVSVHCVRENCPSQVWTTFATANAIARAMPVRIELSDSFRRLAQVIDLTRSMEQATRQIFESQSTDKAS